MASFLHPGKSVCEGLIPYLLCIVSQVKEGHKQPRNDPSGHTYVTERRSCNFSCGPECSQVQLNLESHGDCHGGKANFLPCGAAPLAKTRRGLQCCPILAHIFISIPVNTFEEYQWIIQKLGLPLLGSICPTFVSSTSSSMKPLKSESSSSSLKNRECSCKNCSISKI